ERRVTALAGEAGAKLHTGRSRNDQVATDLRLWARRELTGVARRLLALQRTLLEPAREAGPAYLPGHTPLQRAQPVPPAHPLPAPSGPAATRWAPATSPPRPRSRSACWPSTCRGWGRR